MNRLQRNLINVRPGQSLPSGAVFINPSLVSGMLEGGCLGSFVAMAPPE